MTPSDPIVAAAQVEALQMERDALAALWEQEKQRADRLEVKRQWAVKRLEESQAALDRLGRHATLLAEQKTLLVDSHHGLVWAAKTLLDHYGGEARDQDLEALREAVELCVKP